jgi:hypothetical protein
MKNLKQKEDLGSTRRFKFPKPLFVGAKTLMKAAKIGDAFLNYVILSLDVEPHPPKTPPYYQEFKDEFEKKNVDTLPKHRPYSCTIDLVEGSQPLLCFKMWN